MIKIDSFKEGGLITENIPYDILHAYENIPVEIYKDEIAACKDIADIVIKKINSSKKGTFKIGISNGTTPVALEGILIDAYKRGKVSFKNVEFFITDEYLPTDKIDVNSRSYNLFSTFFSKIDVPEKNIHIPSCSRKKNIEKHCAEFDKAATGMDLLLVGMTEQGEVGLNEIGCSGKGSTKAIMLSYQYRKSIASKLITEFVATPKAAVKMGFNTMLSAKQVILMAWGEDKAACVKQASEDAVSPNCPASYFQAHPNVTLFADINSAANLKREATPWKVGKCNWTSKLKRSAILWLCQQTQKPILKLTLNDYLMNSLDELIADYGPYDKLNIEAFNELQHTITGWPGGKPNADDTTRPVKSKPFPKKVIIFSPHPDDDVISMGGTLIRLVEQGHDVHVAYQTSGNIAVHDSVVMQHIDAAKQLGYGDRLKEVKKLIDSKKPGQAEPRALLNIKGAIRRSEARAALDSIGINVDTNAHFLDLPFYESGGIKKNPCGQEDVEIIKNLLQQIKPDQIYMAGDLADPHGTHRVCSEAVIKALNQLDNEAWVKHCTVWLYRGAWMEWDPGLVDMAVPLSPSEIIKKRHAIFRHLSQKDIVPFPGNDPREFWQRAEERTQNTAILYNALGMAEYQAIELFVKL
ncbi:MAG: glucosamine-6-phosphate deaminase [Bacteroidales bacterium]|nr:glucosamine-6-phosphate deaminase [Bacteroidales bacterium]